MTIRSTIFGPTVAVSIALGTVAWLASLALVMVSGPAERPTIDATRVELPYSVCGKHLVGIQSVTIEDEPRRETKVWYPASRLGAGEPTITYPYEVKMFAHWGRSLWQPSKARQSAGRLRIFPRARVEFLRMDIRSS